MNNQQNSSRISTYSILATELALLSNQSLAELVKDAMPVGTGIGGTSALLEIAGKKIFLKKIRITDIERQPENIMSTGNIFGLPFYYQYGIGSAGFGVWRELATHVMTTNWVLAGECSNFPLMYHWRLLPRTSLGKPTSKELAELESDVEWWGGSSIIRARLLENLKASADILVFLEYFPENLHQWLGKKILEGGNEADLACKIVENRLRAINSFINYRGLLHFDAHFNNILTDGHDLYYADFGLATSSAFELSEDESLFFKKNYNYDQCYTMTYFVEWLLAKLFDSENWVIGNYNALLHDYAAGRRKALLPEIERIIRHYAPIAVVMNDFFIKLKKSKTTLYPTTELERVCAANKIFEK